MIRKHKVLLTLNAALLVALACATIGVSLPEAKAQNSDRARGQYSMISARSQGEQADTLYVLDNANQDMVVMRWVSSRLKLEGLGYVRLDDGEEGR